MSLYNFLSELNNILHVKFYVKLIDESIKTKQEKY